MSPLLSSVIGRPALVMPACRCSGVLRTETPCKLSRAHSGKPIQIRGPCKKCKERRCRTHCRCGRKGLALGRESGRPVVRQVPRKAPAPPEHVAVTSVAAPVGRPANLGCEVLGGSAWWRALVEETRYASEVVVASYMLDHVGLCAALQARLSGRSAFSAVLLVDKASFEERRSFRQRSCLAALRALGAEVRLCKGSGRRGAFHVKAVVVDRRVCFTGSANLTTKSRDNVELHLRLVGSPLRDVLEVLQRARASGHLWQGN